MLAESFGFHHVSLGELRRSHLASIRSGVPHLDERIRQCVREEREIPESLLAEYETVPAILQYYNRRASGNRGTWTLEIASKMLNETLADIRAQAKPEGKPQVIIVDGHPLNSGKLSARLVEMFATSFSGLTIVLESPREIAKKRYVERARQVGGDLEERFDARMELTDRILPGFIETMARHGEIIRSKNDETMSPDTAYAHLLGALNKSKAWLSLLEKTGNST
ncbi:hypothetical protein F5Y09DRAFT_354973 [Xylaria sp. FL1042]|nr:hypothetical protein F5Y09DRAFT_354973 [Xylaria sp. FL1042]